MNKPPLFVAISGKKQSGKDELARLINLRIPSTYWSQITHFADPLKEICIKLFGLDPKLVYGNNADKEQLTTVMWDGLPTEVRRKYATQLDRSVVTFGSGSLGLPRTGPMTHRELLQVMGTDIFRERVYQNIWAELPFKQDYSEYQGVVLIPDARFPNELAETLKHNGIVIRIVRDTANKDNHPSETALDNYDWAQPDHFVIQNNSTLDNLRTEASRLVDVIMRRLENGKECRLNG